MPVRHLKIRNSKLYGTRVFNVDAEGRVTAEDGSNPTPVEAARFATMANYHVTPDDAGAAVEPHATKAPEPEPPKAKAKDAQARPPRRRKRSK